MPQSQRVNRVLNILMGFRLSYRLIPAVAAGAATPGVPVTSGAPGVGADVNLVAAKGIVVDFWACQFNLDTQGGAIQIMELHVWQGAAVWAIGTQISSFRYHPSLVTPNIGAIPVGPYPVRLLANAQVQMAAAGAAARVLGVSLLYGVNFI